eukprot:4277140-Pyramimonas_sp.AAC.1
MRARRACPRATYLGVVSDALSPAFQQSESESMCARNRTIVDEWMSGWWMTGLAGAWGVARLYAALLDCTVRLSGMVQCPMDHIFEPAEWYRHKVDFREPGTQPAVSF